MPDASAGALFPRAYSAEDSARLCSLDTKAVFGLAMGDIAETDDALCVAVSDYGRRLSLERMVELRPEALVQCGIAEQSQVEISSGLANEGLHVFTPAYAPFITARVLDQVRVMLGMMESPVALVGLHSGFGAGILGASHMGLEDIADMRAIPNVRVVCPADNVELHAALLAHAAHPQPAYIRITDDHDGYCVHPEGCTPVLDRAEWLAGAPGDKAQAGFVCCGNVTGRVLAAAQILAGRGISCAVVKMTTVKPLDPAVLEGLAGCGLIVSVEEHSVVGGLGSAVAECLCERGGAPALLRLGTPDAYLDADRPVQLLERAGLTPGGIAESVCARLGR